METQNTPDNREGRRDRVRGSAGRPLGGLVLITVGSILMAHQMGYYFPHWMFTWEMIPIGIGLFIGARHSFRIGGWLIPIFIGVAFLVQEEILDYDMRHFFWPTAIILMGLFMIFRPRRRRWEKEIFKEPIIDTPSGDYLDSFNLFGGVQKNIISKSFKGGKIETFFGGTDLNMMQADFEGTIVIHFNVAFGGVKIVVPAQWNIKNDISVVLGGIEDKRTLSPNTDATKVLVLSGTVLLGGVEIKSY